LAWGRQEQPNQGGLGARNPELNRHAAARAQQIDGLTPGKLKAHWALFGPNRDAALIVNRLNLP
jgi:hypothetical protein